LPTRFELPEGPYTVTSNDTFDGYLRDGAPENVVTYLTTAVHETTHGYMGRMAFQLLAERSLPWGEGALAILVDHQPWLVRHTVSYPAVEMDATFPADAHTFRYDAYVVSDNPTLATQAYGVYGLLDELAAAYHGSRTTVDLWPWVRDESPADERVLVNYAVALDDAAAPPVEFEFFIVHYLVHARERHPDVYEAVLANAEFRGAFEELRAAYEALLAEIAALEPIVFALANERGADVGRRDGVLTLGGRLQRPENAAPFRAILTHLEEQPYREMLASLQ
jgi:hypothetical protein